METLAGVPLMSWAVYTAVVLGAVLLVRGVAEGASPERRGLATLLIVAGSAIVIGSVLVAPRVASELPARMTGGLAAIALAIALAIVCVALVDLAFGRVGPAATRALRTNSPSTRGPMLTGVVATLLVVALAFGGLAWASRAAGQQSQSPPPNPAPTGSTAEPSPSVGVPDPSDDPLAPTVLELAGGPMDIALDGDASGYVMLDEGGIQRFELLGEPTETLRLEAVVTDITHGRGVAVADGRLYAVELGDVCRVAGADCSPLIPEGVPFDADVEAEFLSTARGRVVAFDLTDSGEPGPRREILVDLPVASFAHAPNGLTVAPNGGIYLPVGGVDWLWETPERVAELGLPHPEWLGTLLRLETSGGEPEIVAEGLRNVYEVSFDDQSRIWGVDNNGWTQAGWRAEELLQIKPGQNYGYPYEGTFGPHVTRTDSAVWTSPHVGSAGTLWTGDTRLGAGVAVGSCGQLTLFAPVPTQAHVNRESGLTSWTSRELIPSAPGCFTSIVALPSGDLVASLYQSPDKGALYVIPLGGNR